MNRLDEWELARVDWQANMILAYVCANKDMALQCPVDETLPEPEVYWEKYVTTWGIGLKIVLKWGEKQKVYMIENASDCDISLNASFIIKEYEANVCTFIKYFNDVDIIKGGNFLLDAMITNLAEWYKAAGTE